MEKIESLYMADGCRRTTDEMLASKLNEIVAWINKQEQAGGEHDPK